MKTETEIYIISEFERKRNIKHQERRLYDDTKIIEILTFSLSVQKSKIIKVLKNNNFVIEEM